MCQPPYDGARLRLVLAQTDREHGVFHSAADGQSVRQQQSTRRNPVGGHIREPQQLALAAGADRNSGGTTLQGALLRRQLRHR